MQKDQLVQKKESSLRKLRQKERVLKGILFVAVLMMLVLLLVSGMYCALAHA